MEGLSDGVHQGARYIGDELASVELAATNPGGTVASFHLKSALERALTAK